MQHVLLIYLQRLLSVLMFVYWQAECLVNILVSKTSRMDVLQCDFMTLITLTVLINATASAEQTIKRIRIRSPLFSRCCFPDSPLLT